MKLLEYQAHAVFHEYGLPSIDGLTATTVDELKEIDGKLPYPVVIKAQVQTGGRGKAGGIQFAENRDELLKKGEQVLTMSIKDLPVDKVFVTPKVAVKKELYLSFTMDRKAKLGIMIFSPEGGMEINEIAETTPEKVAKVLLPAGDKLDDFIIQYAAPCAAWCKGEYGLDGMYVGVPVVIGAGGIEKVVEINLNAEEKAMFETSVAAVQGLVDACKTIDPSLG